jgi:hypothetical protein
MTSAKHTLCKPFGQGTWTTPQQKYWNREKNSNHHHHPLCSIHLNAVARRKLVRVASQPSPRSLSAARLNPNRKRPSRDRSPERRGEQFMRPVFLREGFSWVPVAVTPGRGEAGRGQRISMARGAERPLAHPSNISTLPSAAQIVQDFLRSILSGTFTSDPAYTRPSRHPSSGPQPRSRQRTIPPVA